MPKSKSKRPAKEIQSRIWEQARRDELAGKGKDVDYDPPCKYKRNRVAAAKRVERWIMKDDRVLHVFRDRIRDAGDLHLETRRVGNEVQIDMPSDSIERMRLYYCFLAAIHDTDLKIGATITGDIWPDHLLRYMHVPFWAYRGVKNGLIEAALECVKRDLTATIEAHSTTGQAGDIDETSVPEGQSWSRIMPRADIALRLFKDANKWRSVMSAYEDRLKQIGGKGSRQWQIRLDGLPENLVKELNRL